MMKQYEKYKPSGVEWLGDIPEHWNVMRLKYLFSFGKGLNITKENLVNNGISVINYGQVHSKANKGTIIIDQLIRYVSEDYLLKNKQSLVNKGDFIVADTSEDLDGVGNCVYVDRNSCLFAGYHTIILKSLIGNKNKYFSYLFLSNEWRSQLRSRVSGIKVYSITKGILSDNTVVTPTPIEQEQIVAFLDENCDLIDCVIKNRLKQIELLRQERQTIIYNAVTRGIDKDIELKSAKTEWIGYIPKHWDEWKISRAFRQIGSGTTPKSGLPEYYEDGTEPWINTGDLNDGELFDCSRRITIKALNEHSTLKVYDENTLLVALYGATIGKVSLLKFNACTNQACCAIGKSSVIDMQFAFYWFIANKQNLINLSYGGGQPNISQDIIRELRIPTPPKEEQLQIVEFIGLKTNKMDSVIQKYERQIELLKEYKAALISQAVTGAIHIRK